MLDTTRHRALLGARFLDAAARYWIGSYPAIRFEVRRMRRRALRIPDPTLRAAALAALDGKWGNLEGAAAFAAFAPPQLRNDLARLLVRVQGIYDYADILAEQPSEDPQADTIALHKALLDTLCVGTAHGGYYAHHPHDKDDGYLVWLVKRCRLGVARLPTYALVALPACTHAQRIVDYQTRINLAGDDEHAAFAAWAQSETPPATGLYWWETGAACGSSLALLALLAAAADPALTSAQAASIEAVYWPWAGALHTLLDNLIDRAEDHATRQHNLTDHYSSPHEMAERFELLARKTAECSAAAAPHHRTILAGMIALYLTDEQAWTPWARPATERILEAIGPLVRPALLLLRIRRLAVKDRPFSPAISK